MRWCCLTGQDAFSRAARLVIVEGLDRVGKYPRCPRQVENWRVQVYE